MQLPYGGEDVLLPPEEPFDPASDTAVTGPEALSEGDGPWLTIPADDPPAEGATQVKSPEDEPLPEFDPRWREEFSGLLYLGALTDDFTWAGHSFKIKTLLTEDFLEIALAQKKWKDTLGDSRAYVTGVVAACLISVDGRSLPRPITTDPADTDFSNAFDYVRRNYYPWVVDHLYQRYMELERKAEAVVEAMGKASG